MNSSKREEKRSEDAHGLGNCVLKGAAKYDRVVSSGHFHAFHVVFVPLEYIPTIPPHSTYIIVLSYFSEVKTARYVLRKINKICIFSQNTKLFFTWFPSLKV